MPQPSACRITVALAAATLLFLLGCATRPAPQSSELPFEAPPRFTASGQGTLPDRWWTALEDPALDRLVEQALQDNFDLASSWQRLRQAQAVLRRESAPLYPALDVTGSGSIRRPRSETDEFQEDQQLQLGLAAEYEVDLWGQIRSQAAAERFRARATYADYQTAALTVSAEVVRVWYRLAAARLQRDLLQEQIEANQQILDLIESRFVAGQVRSADILRQRQLVESTREQLIDAESRIQTLEHALAVLLGKPPQEEMAPQDYSLPDLPPLPATGLTTDLVQRRPDILSAFNLLASADRELAAAIADQYPSLSFQATIFTEGETANDLFDEWIRNFTGNLVFPLFRGNALAAEADRAGALKRQRLADYAQTTLVAFQEVEDALIQEQKQADRIESLQTQIQLASQTYEQLRIQYFNGVTNYIDVLTALIEIQQLRRDLIAARLALLEFRIALYRALAGGFGTQREENFESPRVLPTAADS